MQQTLKGLILALFLAMGTAFAQESWEVGLVGGLGFAHDLTLQGPPGTAKVGFRNGIVFGGYLGDDAYKYFSGEVRYLYRASDLRLLSGGTTATFNARTHILTGDFLVHFQPRSAPVRPFVSFGGGAKILQGTGMESSAQPLGLFAGLTNTREVLPTGDVGFGVKIKAARNVRVRFEIRDYISRNPSTVIAPAPGITMKGILNDFLGLASVAYTW